MQYFIIGFKNSGKTTLGRQLAERLQFRFLDLDEYIEEKEGKSIPEIYSRLGDEGFRRIEWKWLKEVAGNHENIVIATGGGAPCHCDNMTLMERYGDVIYLRVSNKILVERLKHAAKDRPIVLGKTEEELRHYISDLIDRCEHHYKRAKYIIDGDNLNLDHVIEILQKA